ncbi:hypothetical protein SAMN04487866_1226 [Thermoactinomyces sp. DSM 45891]|uniref:hypothetical protein n=1 Tax=Thermoactinomyces sp. DSM 45891 TaxID=1761907 RepID=UPI0009173465|nr:hypothetical protein [Thermoactinomyces sp. DSM 45891]SFX74572.1 hypothetical protein SAMN04487866_1226 [Thermoactinomyces sp. DSM 45891]
MDEQMNKESKKQSKLERLYIQLEEDMKDIENAKKKVVTAKKKAKKTQHQISEEKRKQDTKKKIEMGAIFMKTFGVTTKEDALKVGYKYGPIVKNDESLNPPSSSDE